MAQKDLELAKKELKQAVEEGNYPEVARIIGAPVDPRKDYARIVKAVSDIEPPADPKEYLFYFDVDEDVKEVYTLTNTGTVTVQQITPNSESAVPFATIESKAYKVHIVDLLNAKFDVIGKKKRAVTRSLDAEEIKKVLDLLLAGTPVANQFTKDSSDTYFTYPKLIDMMEAISDYAEDYALIVGSDIWKDIKLWDYNENKYHSLKAMFDDLDIEMIKVTGTVAKDGGAQTALLNSKKAILVGRSTIVGKPVSFGRKIVEDAKALGEETNEAKQRKVVVLPAVIANNEKPGVSVWGFEQIGAVLKNSKAVASYSRA